VKKNQYGKNVYSSGKKYFVKFNVSKPYGKGVFFRIITNAFK
jgi:hypothetical protein